MTNDEMRAEVHEQFDAICARVGDWEPLPAVTAVSLEHPEFEEDGHDEERTAPLNEMILAGLLAPY